MRIFEVKKSFGRISFVLFDFSPFFSGIKFQFRNLLAEKKNLIIPLGTNCYPRMLLTKYGIKARRKHGELTFPFDLIFSDMGAILHFLANDFKDFFDNVEYNQEKKCWCNTFWRLVFPHDNYSKDDKELFIKRYIRRIDNFYNVLRSKNNLCFVSIIREDGVTARMLNEIYSLLKEKCCGNCKYIVIQTLYSGEYIDYENLNNEILFRKMDLPCEDYFYTWFLKDLNKRPNYFEVSSFTHQCVEELNNLINL